MHMPVKLFLSVLVILIISHVVVAEDVNMYSFKSIAKQYISFDSTYLVISFVHPGDCVKCSVQPLKLLSEIEKIVPCKIVEAIFCQRKIEYDYILKTKQYSGITIPNINDSIRLMNGIDAKINFVLLNSKGEMEFKCNSLEDSREELRKFKLRFQ